MNNLTGQSVSEVPLCWKLTCTTVPNVVRTVTLREQQASKRDLLKKAAYIAPAILTLNVVPSFGSSGSARAEKDKEKGNNGVGNGIDPQPPGNPPVNDGPGTSPGNPGNKHKNKNSLPEV